MDDAQESVKLIMGFAALVPIISSLGLGVFMMLVLMYITHQ